MDVGTLLVDGGLTQSKTLVQAQANLLQVPVRAYTGAHATAQGAAALARLALDRNTTVELELTERAAKPVVPTWSPERAAEYRERWRQSAGAARERAPAALGV
jgi:glycerol kinase